MYGISKDIRAEFSVLTTPSYGTISPALNRLCKLGCLKSQKTMSKGGRPSVYYSITNEGKEKFKELMLAKPVDNPIQFLSVSRVKIACSGILNDEEQSILYKLLKQKAEIILAESKAIIQNNNKTFYSSIVMDNLMCEYKNFISLIQGLENSKG
ncbi:MAG: PadR family transcriptional regulator [bacterium]|nr:PadR family transcriptional regulator [bacterium]